MATVDRLLTIYLLLQTDRHGTISNIDSRLIIIIFSCAQAYSIVV